MFDFIEFFKAILSLAIALICPWLSKYRYKKNKEYAERYFGNINRSVLRLLITYLLKGISIAILLGIITKTMDSFIAFYILTPVLVAMNLILFDGDDRMWGFMTFIKGLYYLGLVVISTVQFLLESAEVSVLALGFTLSLAIFESVTALSDGYRKLYETKRYSDN